MWNNKNKALLLELAIDVFYNVCKNGTPVMDKDGNIYSGLIYLQPSRSSSFVGLKYVHLINCNGEFARYNIKTGEITV